MFLVCGEPLELLGIVAGQDFDWVADAVKYQERDASRHPLYKYNLQALFVEHDASLSPADCLAYLSRVLYQ